MSNFDPKSPSYIPPGGIVVDTGDSFNILQGNQTAQTLLAVGTMLTASTAISVNNFNCRGGLFFLDVTALPASASTTIAMKIQVTDPVGGRTATIASRAAVSVSGQASLMLYPGISTSAAGVPCALPRTFSVALSISSAAANKSCHLTLSYMRIL